MLPFLSRSKLTNNSQIKNLEEALEKLKEERLKSEREDTSYMNENTKWAFEVTVSLLINYNQQFVSKYTTFYKTYMVLTALILTLIANNFFSGSFEIEMMNKKEGLLNEKFSSLESWINLVSYFFPFRGKFSLIFFQLMFVTTIQIIYETVIELHYRFRTYLSTKHKTPMIQHHEDEEREQYLIQIDRLSKYVKAKMEQEEYEQYEKEHKRININKGYDNKKSSIEPSEVNDIIYALKFLLENSNEINGRKLLCEIKFMYLFALMYAESILWEGIIIKRWRSKYVHLFIIACCVAEFLIWVLINSVLEATQQNVTFGDKNFVELGPNCEISLGMY